MKIDNILQLLFILFYTLIISNNNFAQSGRLGIRDASGQIQASISGTGRSIGHVLTMQLENTGTTAVEIVIGPLYIPGTKKGQPNIIPGTTSVTVPPGTTIDVLLEGVCTDPNKPPLGEGKPGPVSRDWVTPDQLPDNWTPDMDNGWESDDNNPLINPVTGTPLGHTIDTDKYPMEASGILLEYVHRIDETIKELHESGAIFTPYSGNIPKERLILLQHTVWLVANYLRGGTYTIDDLTEYATNEYAKNTSTRPNKIPDDVLDDIFSGVDDIWDVIQMVGVEAKIFNPDNVEIDHEAKPAEIPGTTYGEPHVNESELSEEDRYNNDLKNCFLNKFSYRIELYHEYERKERRDRKRVTIQYKDTHHADANNEFKINLERGDKLTISIKDANGQCLCWTAIAPDTRQKTGGICEIELEKPKADATNQDFNKAFDQKENGDHDAVLEVKRKYKGTQEMTFSVKIKCLEDDTCKGAETTRTIRLKLTAPRPK